MPFIIMKRGDIPGGTLQMLDLEPNESQRNQTIDPPGQTKYVNGVVDQPVVTRGGGGSPTLAHRAADGFSAWFLTNVNDGTGAPATGALFIGAGNAAPGDSMSVNALPVGGPNVTFNFVAGAPVASTDVQVGGSEDITAANLAAAIANPLNGLVPYVSVAAPGGGPPSPANLTAVSDGTASNAIGLVAVGANLSVSAATLLGGVDAGPLTANQANAMASLILVNLLGYGSSLPPSVLTLGSVNGVVSSVVATASITSGQLLEVLSILSGRVYKMPESVQIANSGGAFEVLPAVGAPGGPRFVDPTIRNTYDTGALKISFGEGELSVYTSPSFVYRGVADQAVVVYNDDGTFYTGM
jgi:hypothetical protein